MSLLGDLFGGGSTAEVEGMWRERNMHQRRANDAEARGFPGTARRARKAAREVEERIEAAESDRGFWSW